MTNDLRVILASKSRARQDMLKSAGLAFDPAPADIDESEIIQSMTLDGAEIGAIAQALANKKALSISKKFPEELVIGSDQALDFKDEFIEKAETEEEAIEKLKAMRGSAHRLISAVSVSRGDKILWQHSAEATLTMHDFSDEYLEGYCERAFDALTNCVGAYEFEGAGSWLFSSIEGDYFTILGMPLLPLLNYLREEHGAMP